MHTRTFITLFIMLHIGFIFLQIYKQSYLVELSYQKQKNEKIKEGLQEKKYALIQQLYVLQDRESVKAYAQNSLHMQPISLKQIRKYVDESAV
jgi:AAA15 family ATPase/GTPase